MDILVTYKAHAEELARAAAYFFHKKIVMIIVKQFVLVCALLTVSKSIFVFTHTKILSSGDLLIALLMLVWVYGHKHLHYWTILFSIKKWIKKVDVYTYYLHKDYIELQMQNYKLTQYWKHIKKVYLYEDGYIIPFTGFRNSGKFAWLPRYAFTTKHEQEFLEHLQNKEIILNKC